MTVRQKMRVVGKGILWAVFPVHAFRQIVSTKDSLVRIYQMARRGKTRDAEAITELSDIDRKRYELEAEGRDLVLQLEEHDRFIYMANALDWTEEAIEKEMRALARSHMFRYCLLIFTVVLSLGLTVKFGLRPFVFGSAASLYLIAACVKTACLYTQLEERALWSLGQIVKRPGLWILRRALWILG